MEGNRTNLTSVNIIQCTFVTFLRTSIFAMSICDNVELSTSKGTPCIMWDQHGVVIWDLHRLQMIDL